MRMDCDVHAEVASCLCILQVEVSWMSTRMGSPAGRTTREILRRPPPQQSLIETSPTARLTSRSAQSYFLPDPLSMFYILYVQQQASICK